VGSSRSGDLVHRSRQAGWGLARFWSARLSRRPASPIRTRRMGSEADPQDGSDGASPSRNAGFSKAMRWGRHRGQVQCETARGGCRAVATNLPVCRSRGRHKFGFVARSCAVTSASRTRNRFWMSLTQGRRGAAAPGRSKMSPAGNGFDGRLVRPWNIGSEWTSALFHGPWCGGPLAGIRCPNRPTGNRAAADRWLVVVNDHRQTVTAVMGRDARCRNPGDDLPATSLTPQPRRRAPAGDHRRHSDSETPFPNDMPKTDAARLPGRRDCGSRIPLRHQAVTPVRRRANFLASKHNTPAPAIKAVEGSGIAVRVTVAFPSYPCV